MARHTEHAAAPDKEKEGPHNRAEEYFRQFMRLLGEHYTRERSVGFLRPADVHHAKYLTTLIKRVSGKSVSEWIDSYVILEAKTLLEVFEQEHPGDRLLPQLPEPVVLLRQLLQTHRRHVAHAVQGTVVRPGQRGRQAECGQTDGQTGRRARRADGQTGRMQADKR